MECVRCFCSNEPHRRFCYQCGHALVTGCHRCGFFNRVIDRFCGGCGNSLLEQSDHSSLPRNNQEQASTLPIPTKPIFPSPPVPFSVSGNTSSKATCLSPANFSPTEEPDCKKSAVAVATPKATGKNTNDIEISEHDLQELLTPSSQTTPTLPSKVSQEDIDKLFGG